MTEFSDSTGRRPRFSRPIILSVLLGISLFATFIFILSPDASSKRYPGGGAVSVASAMSGPNAFSSGGPYPLGPDNSEPAVPEKLSPGVRDLSGDVREFRIDRSDTFYGIMSEFGVTGAEIQRIVRNASDLYDLKHVKRNSILKVTAKGGEWQKIEYDLDHFDALVIEKDPGSEDGIKVAISELPHEVRETIVTGTIEKSLYEDGVKAGADPQVLVGLSEIFAWDMDFGKDIRRGDKFTILYESLYVNGEYVSSDRILGAEIENKGVVHSAIYYESGDGVVGYYDESGKSLRRSLLKAPLRFRRITSYYTNRRWHPILKRYRPHHGIDYAAPRGTPVTAAGSGTVVYAGRKGGYGRLIQIRHKNSYSTIYAHLSRVKNGVRRGAKVKQGDIIGYVGSTGISTGPHLHYEVRLNNRPINPLKLKSVPAGTVPKEELRKFASVRDEIAKRLSGGDTMVASSGPLAEGEKEGSSAGN